MARPTKKGLDYFPLDVSFENSSVEDIECMYGMLGVAIIITMWQYIYRTNGYYCDYSEKIALRLSKRFGNQLHAINSEKMAYDVFDEVIKKAIEYDAFDADIYKKYGVLTSKGIQERYLEATKKRKNVEVISDYLLLNDEAKTVNVYINGVNDGINSKKVDVNTQSKVKESKLNKSKLNKSKLNKSKLNKSKLNKSEV
ncbi:MAG: DUF4373 domain-containing protein, partial [Oscillospiraceae bacterium]